jgi:hypothetical protein
MSPTEVLLDRRRNDARDAVMQRLLKFPGAPETTESDVALKTGLDAYAIPSGWWRTGGECTARGVVFDPDGQPGEGALHILFTYDASVHHPIAHHSGWLVKQNEHDVSRPALPRQPVGLQGVMAASAHWTAAAIRS